jgi:hypothetical protein
MMDPNGELSDHDVRNYVSCLWAEDWDSDKGAVYDAQ